MELSMIWKCATSPCAARAAFAAAVLTSSLQTTRAGAQAPSWQDWTRDNCDEVVELRAHARNSKDPLVIPANQELQEKVYFNSDWGTSAQVVGIYPLVGNRKVLADFTLHATEIAPREGVRRLYDWFPGDSSASTPVPPVAYVLPQGPNTLMLELHYSNVSGPEQVDQSGVWLCLKHRDTRLTSRAGVTDFDVPNVRIPRQSTNHVVSRTCTVQSDQPVLLQFAAPGMHKLGKSFKLLIESAGGAPPLKLERSYSFGERSTYRLYPDPVVYRGDRITTTCVYDNLSDRDISGGWRSDEEVCRMTVVYYPENDFVCN